MNPTRMRDLDNLIEDALKSEPLREVPASFHVRVMERVQGTAMEEADQRGMQFRFAAGALVFLALGASLFAVPFFSFFLAWVGRLLPGEMGYFARILTFVMQSHAMLVTSVALGGLLAVAGLATTVAVWLVRNRRSRGYRAI